MGRPGELRGALEASWASPLFGLLSGSGITSLGGGSWRLEAWGEAGAPGSGGCPVTSWPCHCHCLGCVTIYLIILTLPDLDSSDVILRVREQRGGTGRGGEKVKTDWVSLKPLHSIAMSRECGSPARRLSSQSSERRESMVANMMSYLRIPPRAEVSRE